MRRPFTRLEFPFDQRVSLTVENATVDEVFRKLLERTGLTFRRFQNVVEIRPAQE